MISAGAKGRESPTDRPATPDTAPAAAPLKRAPSFGGMWDWGFGRQEPSSPISRRARVRSSKASMVNCS